MIKETNHKGKNILVKSMYTVQSAKILLLPSKCEIIFAPHLLIAVPTLR